MKALTKEKKEKENALKNLELINLKNVFLLQFERIERNTNEAEREKLMEDKEYKRNLQCLQA
jgi:hypothetical protein